MKVTITFKSQPDLSISYDMDPEEITRLTSDFQDYSAEGNPQIGIYQGCTVGGDKSIKMSMTIRLDFKDIASIE